MTRIHKSTLQNETARLAGSISAIAPASNRDRDRDRDRVALTDWLRGTEPPAHEGVYLRRAPGGPYSCFSGDRWFGDAAQPADAAASQIESAHQAIEWRGLTTPPSAPCGTCRGHTVVDRGVDQDLGTDLIEECPDC